MPEITDPPEPINSAPRDISKHWSIIDQTKAEFSNSGRSGVIIYIEPDDPYRAKLGAFLAKFKTSIAQLNTTKPYLVIEHATEAEAVFQLVLAAGLHAELFKAKV
jgi:hypothetical protein